MIDTSAYLKLDDVDVAGKRVLLRCDLNVPVDEGQILDDGRIREALPTIESLVARNARVILMSHLGAPAGKINSNLSLEPVAMRLAELLTGGEVILTDACVGGGAKRVALDLRDGQVAVLENLGFHVGEEANDDKFSRELAALGEVYVGDAFRVMRERRASMVGVLRHVATRAAGPRLFEELSAVEKLLRKVERPYVAVVGGDDLQGRLPLIQSLLERVDTLVLGGGVGNAFVAATRGPLGGTAVETGKFANCRDLVAKASAASGKRLLLPTDFTVSNEDESEVKNARFDQISGKLAARDIGEESRAAFRDVLSRAGTVLWVGLLGTVGREPFKEGSLAVARAVAGSAAYSAVYGAEAAGIVAESGLEKGFSHISVGERTALTLVEGRTLPSVEAMRK